MNAASEYLERVRLLVEQHAPQDVALPMMAMGAVAFIVMGLGMSVLGAKLARISLTFSLAIAGLAGGVYLTRFVDVPIGLAGLLGAGVFGVLGFVLHRLWVGVATGMMFMVVLNSTYGANTLGPQFEAFQLSHGAMPSLLVEKPLPSNESIRVAGVNPVFGEWVGGFWEFARARDESGVHKLALMTACAGTLGLVLGLLAVRFTLVTVTSLVGTLLISSGAVTLVQQWQPDLYQAGLAHPQAIGVACASFLLGSLVLQTLLTRPDKPAAAKSKS